MKKYTRHIYCPTCKRQIGQQPKSNYDYVELTCKCGQRLKITTEYITIVSLDKLENIAHEDIKDQIHAKIDLEILMSKLTEQEKYLCERIMAGYNHAEIAQELRISPQRVSELWKNIQKRGGEIQN